MDPVRTHQLMLRYGAPMTSLASVCVSGCGPLQSHAKSRAIAVAMHSRFILMRQ